MDIVNIIMFCLISFYIWHSWNSSKEVIQWMVEEKNKNLEKEKSLLADQNKIYKEYANYYKEVSELLNDLKAIIKDKKY